MTQLRILLFFISILVTSTVSSQQEQDTIKTIESYGIRVGIDLNKPINSFFESDTKGFEIDRKSVV